MTFFKPNRSTTSTAWERRRFRSVSSDIKRSIAAAKALVSPAGTSKPSVPFRIIVLGPLGQSKLITGNPQAIASQSTLGKPSNLDDKTKTSDSRNFPNGSVVRPGKLTLSVKPI